MHDQITSDLRFSIVPAWLLDSGISDKAIRLYAVLAGYADSETGQAYPGRKLLSKRLDCSTKTVDRAVSELIEAKAIKKQQRVKDGYYQSSLYTVVRIDPGSGMTRPSVEDDATSGHPRRDPVSPVSHRTITTELEPKELEPLNNLDDSKSKSSKLSKLPSDWYPSDRLLDMFSTKWPDVDRDYEIEQFINYWHAEGKTKADWDKAFQVWMNRNQKRSTGRGPAQGRRLTNSENAALLAMKYREQTQAIEVSTNEHQVKQLENETVNWLKEID